MTAPEWFFLQGTKQVGPFTRDQIHSLFESASIHWDTLVWRPGCPDWTPLSTFEEFGDPSQRKPATSAGHDGSTLPDTLPQPLAVQEGPPPLINAQQWVDETPHPWRRFFARYLDYLFWGTATMFVLGVALAITDMESYEKLNAVLDGPHGDLIATVLSIVLAAIANSVLIGLTGGNLGKWLFGICVLDGSDRPIGLLRSFQREGRVILQGMGLFIPIASLVTMIVAYRRLKDGATSWDRALSLKIVHRKRGIAQNFASVVGLLLLIGLLMGLTILGKMAES